MESIKLAVLRIFRRTTCSYKLKNPVHQTGSSVVFFMLRLIFFTNKLHIN